MNDCPGGQQIIVSTKHKVVVLPHTNELARFFPASKTLDIGSQRHIVIPHQPAEAWLLQNKFGLAVPAPILTNYEFKSPPGEIVFEAQKQTAAMLSMNSRAYVLNGLGTGKTRSALYAWDYLYSLGLCGKSLVLAPLSTLSFTWGREIFNVLPHRKCEILYGSRDKRIKRL